MKVLGYLLARLGIRLVWAVVEFVANWSLDTVNTCPLMQITRARTYVDCRMTETSDKLRKILLDRVAALACRIRIGVASLPQDREDDELSA